MNLNKRLNINRGSNLSPAVSLSESLTPNLAFLLQSKANLEDVKALELSKANKTDTEQLLVGQSVLSKQIKYISVLFMESIRLTVENTQDSKMTKEHSRKFLLNQTRTLINQWIIKFDPLNQNSTAKSDGFDFLHALDGEFLKEYTKCIVKDEITGN